MFNKVLLEQDKVRYNEFEKMKEMKKNKEVSKLYDYLSYKQSLTIHQEEMTEIWEILIKRVESVQNEKFFGGEFPEISNKIKEFCNNPSIDNELLKALKDIMIKIEFKSDMAAAFVKDLPMNCMRKILNNQRLPEYIKRMLIVTGLAGKKQYYEDITKRIMCYTENGKYEELLSVVVMHFGNDFSNIITNLKQKSVEYTKKIEKLEYELEKITAKDLEITKKRTRELEKKLEELKMKKKIHFEESRTLKLKSPMTEESSNMEKYDKEEEKLQNELEEIKIKKRLKAQFREHDGKFKTKEEGKKKSQMNAFELKILDEQSIIRSNMTEEEVSKMKEELEKVRKLKEQVQDEEKDFVEKNSELLKLKNLQKIDKDKYGLFSVFNYMLMIKEFKMDECYEETVKEFEFERQLGVLEYEYDIFKKTGSFLHLTVKEKLVKFEQKFKSQYHPQSKIETRKDFVTLKDWLNVRKVNSIETRIEKLKKKFPVVPHVPAVPQISTPPKHLGTKKEKHPKQMIGEDRGEASRMLRRAKSMDTISTKSSSGIHIGKAEKFSKSASFPSTDERKKLGKEKVMTT
uniref:Uncharacterized protein n=1 Tax=Meloidogyne enterolobii TaxID=390850 RepID=A0A6V7WNS5_MELEN|nr:unnamed protein product [Meloidogyne enterolobii]